MRISLVVQWLGVYIFNVGGTGLIPGQGTKSPYAIGLRQKKNVPIFKPIQINLAETVKIFQI